MVNISPLLRLSLSHYYIYDNLKKKNNNNSNDNNNDNNYNDDNNDKNYGNNEGIILILENGKCQNYKKYHHGLN